MHGKGEGGQAGGGRGVDGAAPRKRRALFVLHEQRNVGWCAGKQARWGRQHNQRTRGHAVFVHARTWAADVPTASLISGSADASSHAEAARQLSPPAAIFLRQSDSGTPELPRKGLGGKFSGSRRDFLQRSRGISGSRNRRKSDFPESRIENRKGAAQL